MAEKKKKPKKLQEDIIFSTTPFPRYKETIVQTAIVSTGAPQIGIVTTPAPCAFWSQWINRSRPKAGKRRRGGDRENTSPSMLRQMEGFCRQGSITHIECREATKDIAHTRTGEQKLVCDLQTGFVCRNADQPDGRCQDYKIRYFCSCEKEETTTIFVKATTFSYIHPCNSFVQLIDGSPKLPDTQFSASSAKSPAFGPQNARLSSASAKTRNVEGDAWTAARATEHQFVEVNLTDVKAIYGVITKGKENAAEWVTSYHILYSKDGISYSYYEEESGKPMVFSGNYDDTTESSHIFRQPFEARFVRIEPLSWEGAISLRFDLYGCSEAIPSTTVLPGEYLTTVKPLEKVCEDPLGLENGLISDLQLSASSRYDEQHAASEGRLGSDRAWVALISDDKQYIQVDFIDPQNITGIITKGYPAKHQWVTAYYVAYSNLGIQWDKVTDRSGKPKEFAANYDAESIVTNMLPTPIRTRFLRIMPFKFKGRPSMQLEVLGCFYSISCREPMGVENGLITKYQISSSSDYDEVSTSTSARLNSVHGWSPSSFDYRSYLQIDFVTPVNITAVVTRGRHDYPKWVKVYNLATSTDGIHFEKLKNGYGDVEDFYGNVDKDTAVIQLLTETIRTRFLRIIPLRYKLAVGLRIEVLGCYEETACLEPMGLENGLLSDGQISASSYKSPDLSPTHARMNDPTGWSPSSVSGKQYIQVDFLDPREVSAVVTKGRGDKPHWVTKYQVAYSNDTTNWELVLDSRGKPKTFLGNVNNNSPVVNPLGEKPIRSRYVRIIPVDYKNWIGLRMEILGCYHPYECLEPMGMENGLITNSQLSASSSRSEVLSPEYSRIDSSTAWSAAISNDDQFLQVDLLEDRNVTGLITRGRSDADEWVTAYFIAYSHDGSAWNIIKDPSTRETMEFPGNYDSDSLASVRFPGPVLTRFIKVVPTKWNKWMSMRLEVLGCYHPHVCMDPMGLEDGMISDGQISASSFYDEETSPSNARLNSASAWSAADTEEEQYLKIAFDEPRNITAIITKGRPQSKEWVELYQIAYSYDDSLWYLVLDEFGEPKEFVGNADSDSPVIVVLPETLETQYIKILPSKWHKWISLRLEILGCYHPEIEEEEYPEEVLALTPSEPTYVGRCPSSDMEERSLMDFAKLTASSSAPGSNPSLAKLQPSVDPNAGGIGAWVPDVADLHPVLVIQFLDPKLLTAIQIQGRPDEKEWVKTFRVIASLDNKTWFPVFGPNGDELIEANDDQNTIKGHYFKKPVVAKFVKIMPESWHRWPSFKVRLIGCDHTYETTGSPVYLPSSTVPSTPFPAHEFSSPALPYFSSTYVPVELCPELDSSFINSCPSYCPPGLFCNGKDCVDPVDCTCYHNGEIFAIGDRIEDDHCMQCDCILGGSSVCKKKSCPHCPKGEKQAFNDKCECKCSECAEFEVLCPSNDECLHESRWCDGITDCPDDEVNCVASEKPSFKEEMKSLSPATTIISSIKVRPVTSAPKSSIKISPATKETPLVPAINACEILGRHIKTFDGQNLEYEHCHHIAAKDIHSEFLSISLHKSCPHNVCINWLEVLIDGHIIKITSDLDVQFDGHHYTPSQLVVLNKKSHSNVTIERVGDQVILKHSSKGIKIVYDVLAHLKVQVPSTMHGQLSGLCGYYSGDVSDDQKKPDGQAAYTSQEFGDSWALESHPKDCVPLLCPVEIMAKAEEICNHLKIEPFSRCGDVLAFDTHMEFCKSSLCECLQKNDASENKCKCEGYLPFAEACEEKLGSSALRGWRLKHDCVPDCPEGMVWNDCGPSCQLSCETMTADSLNSCSESCTPGCFCPDGKLLNGDTCITPDKCSDKICQGFGDPHMETFDGFFFPFQTEGTFLIAADSSFSDFVIEAITKPCGIFFPIMCVVGIRVKHNGHEVMFHKRDLVQVDMVKVPVSDLPKFVGGMIVLGFPGETYITLIPKLSVEVRYYAENSGFGVRIPSRRYFNKTVGLCGNCDSNIDDDQSQNNNLNEYVCSWMTEGSIENCNKTSVEKPKNVEPVESCDAFLSNVFSACHMLVDPKNYVEACKYDSLHSGDVNGTLCKILREYSRQCCQAGVVINDWPFKFNCTVECDEGLAYHQCHEACPQTCSSIKNESLHTGCQDLKVDGCFCPDNHVFKDGACLKPLLCETCDEDGHAPGESWSDGPCKTCSCSETLVVSCTTESCPALPVCNGEGESLIKQEKSNNSCCDIYNCVKMPVLCAALEDVPKCPEGEAAKAYAGEDLCPKFKCECDPILCPGVIWPRDLEAGQVAELVKESCCPKVIITCRNETCPEKPVCAPGFEAFGFEGECCTLHKCKPATDVCIYTHHNPTSEGVEEPEKKPVIYKLGDVWQDGLCENCTCIEQNGQLMPQCMQEQCPAIESMPENKHYDLQELKSPVKCCPDIFRIQCKDGYDNLHMPGDEWQSEEDPCVKFMCEISSIGDVQKVKKVIDCPKCSKTSDYIPPSKILHQCCGICRPSKCEESGEIYNVGDVWTPKADPCLQAECVNEWGSDIHIVYTKPSCPTLPEDCPKDKIISDENGCCQMCNLTSEISCSSAPIPLEETVGFFTYYDSSRGGFCKNDDPVPDVLQCKGACHSREYYSLADGDFTGSCKCCKVNITIERSVDLLCPDYSTLRKTVLMPQACQCSKCAPSKGTSTWMKPERIQKGKTSFATAGNSPWSQQQEEHVFQEQKPFFEKFEDDVQQQVEEDSFEQHPNMLDRYQQNNEQFGSFQQQQEEEENPFGNFFGGQQMLED